MRRWTLLLAGAALWLFLAAIPALADGGPHVAANNSGSSTLTADSCAGCHRAHTAQGPSLLKASSESALCLSCHGANGTGATTNVEDGVQYNDGAMPPVRDNTTTIGALRSGGFVYARINSSDPYRTKYAAGAYSFYAKVSVLPGGAQVTSAHLKLDATAGNKVVLQGTAWGNGVLNSGAGPTVSISCGTCHNPHGNGMYRILQPIPTTTGLTAAAAPANVPDYLVGTPAAVPATTRNYTVIQTNVTGLKIFLASEAAAINNAQAGDYFHRKVTWNGTGTITDDAPNGDTANFSTQITAWCSTCHTRYLETGESGATGSGDAIYKYRHATTGSRACTTCHVAHGSNATMPGANSAAFPYPGGTPTNASSRLLKVANRGTCQLCHDPTGTVSIGASTGTTPDPTLP